MMKNIIILGLMLIGFNTFSQNGQVKTTAGTADNLYYKDGKVGIGVSSPDATFHIKGGYSASSEPLLRLSGSGNANLRLGINSGYSWIQSHGSLPLRINELGNNTLLNCIRGSVGIGTTTPAAKLHIDNGDNTYGAILSQADESSFQLYAKTITTQPANIESFRLGLKHGTNENNGFISFYRGGSSVGGFLGFSTYGQERIRIASGGNVGIGKTDPDYKLDVLGTIRAQELKVDMQGADFVFEENYPLRPISELEDFVKVNKHLPEIASAKEMQENGVNQSEMNQKLLQKIEELSLYVIELNKSNVALKKRVEELEWKSKDIVKN